jgi:hypothetical protein
MKESKQTNKIWGKLRTTFKVLSCFFYLSLVLSFHETIKREINKRLTYECRCDEILKSKDERSTRSRPTQI